MSDFTREMLAIGLCLIILAAVYFINTNFRQKVEKQLLAYLKDHDFASYDAYRKKRTTKMFVPEYTMLIMKMNHCIKGKEDALIDQIYDEILALDLNKQEKKDIALRGFRYYLDKGDEERTSLFHDKVNEIETNESILKEVNGKYKVIVEKDDAYLQTLLDEMIEMEDIERYQNEYLVSIIYRRQGEEEKADRYLELSKQHKQRMDEILEKMKKEGKKKKQ